MSDFRLWSTMLHLPRVIFTTNKMFNDYFIDDMRCGDMDDNDLLNLGLNNISSVIDPYTKRFYSHHSGVQNFHSLGLTYPYEPGKEVSHSQCVDILFNEMKNKSQWFANSYVTSGLYNHLITEMIDHFRYGNGAPFDSHSLNSAYNDRMLKENVEKRPLYIISNILKNTINGKAATSSDDLIHQFRTLLSDSHLTKFNNLEDHTNGLGITVHDIYAQEITMLTINEYSMNWSALFYFKAQDHFGLDINDIKNPKFNAFNFFKIWFFLQRHKDYAFKPFFTNFGTHLTLSNGVWK